MAKTQEETDRSNLGAPRRSGAGQEGAGAAQRTAGMVGTPLSKSFSDLGAPMRQYLSTFETLRKLTVNPIALSGMTESYARIQTQMAALAPRLPKSYAGVIAPSILEQYASTSETLKKIAGASRQLNLAPITTVNLGKVEALWFPNYARAVDQLLDDLGLEGAVVDPGLDLAAQDEEYEALAQCCPELASRVDELASAAGTAFLSKRRIRNSLARLVSLLFFAVCTFSEPLGAAVGGWIGALMGGAPGAVTGGPAGAMIGKLASSALNDRGVTSESVYTYLRAPEPPGDATN